MTAIPNGREITDRMIRDEFQRILRLRTFRVDLAPEDRFDERPPTLRIRRYDRPVTKHGQATLDGNWVDLNIGTNIDRFNVEEIILHELAHIYMIRRWPNERVGHARRWRDALLNAYREAHPNAPTPVSFTRHVGPFAGRLRNKFLLEHSRSLHERINTVLQDESQAEIDRRRDQNPSYQNPDYYTDPDVPRELTDRERAFIEGRKLNQDYVRPDSIGDDHLPQPIKNMAEPRQPLRTWFDGLNVDYQRVGQPIESPRDRAQVNERSTPTRTPNAHADDVFAGYTATEIRNRRDQRVLDIITVSPGRNRESIDYRYVSQHGEYPGASTYNSIYRLQKAGKVYREGQRWYATT